MNYKDIVNLNFKHQMAKVSCKLTKGDGITEEDLKTAKIKYYGIPTVKFSEKGIEGKGDLAYITPDSDYSALLVPQDVSGNPFITVELTLTVNNVSIPKTLVYIPEEPMTLEAGKAYTFNIKVQKDRLEVQTISGAWTESPDNTEPVSDKYHINIKLTNLPENIGELLGELEISKNVTDETANTRAGSDKSLWVLGNSFTKSYKATADNCHLGLVFADKSTENQVNRICYEIKQNTEKTSDDAYYMFTYTIVSPIDEPVDLQIGEHVEVCDILFQDGSWGSISNNIYESKELPNEDKKVPVGIVFRIGPALDEKITHLISRSITIGKRVAKSEVMLWH